MRTLYLFRVALVSLEALVLVGIGLAFSFFTNELDALASSLSLKDEVLNYLWLMPVGLAVWVFKEIGLLLQDEMETVRILTGWQEYWKLKAHTCISLGYAVVFAFMSLIPWVAYSGIGIGKGLMFFVASIVGQLCLAISVYLARIRVKEIIAQAKAP